MAALALLHSLPLALDGEAATGGNTDVAIIAVVSMACGYVLLFALWYFVFRDKSRSKRNRDSPPPGE